MASKQDYLYPIRLHYSTYAYNCGMLEEKCIQFVLTLDGVESFGDECIRRRRKQLVIQIEILSTYAAALTVGMLLFIYAVETIKEITYVV